MVPGVTLDLGFTDAVDRSSWNMGTMFEEQERRKTGNLRTERFQQAPDCQAQSKLKLFYGFIF
jgi:hypothetical protein